MNCDPEEPFLCGDDVKGRPGREAGGEMIGAPEFLDVICDWEEEGL
jgi:hypothetical protein